MSLSSQRPSGTRAWRSSPQYNPLDLTVTHALDVAPRGGTIFAFNIVNPNATAIFVKFYNRAAANINAAIDAPSNLPAPIHTQLVPANGSVLLRGSDYPIYFDGDLSVRVCTGISDLDVTPPATAAPIVELDTSYQENIRSSN